MKKNVFVALLMLLFASLACNFSQNLRELGATPTPSKILYQDDFSDTSTGWASITDADGITDYDQGFYRIRVDTVGSDGNGMDMWSHPGQNIEGDVIVEVDATKIGGPDDNDMGVLCRYTKTDNGYNFYYFLISSDGYTAIAKMKDSSSSFISGNEMIFTTVIKLTATNHIRADCIGNQLTLFVNGTKVASATDDDFTGGDVGLIAGSFTTPGVDIHFDNFVVSQP